MHQGDERAHDHRHTAPGGVAHDGGHLEAQALAAARGHEHQGVAASAHVVDDLALLAPVLGVAKNVVQNVFGVLLADPRFLGRFLAGFKHNGRHGGADSTRPLQHAL